MKTFVAVLAVAALAAAKPEAQYFGAANPWTAGYSGLNAYTGYNGLNAFAGYNGLNAYTGYNGLSPYGYSPLTTYGVPQAQSVVPQSVVPQFVEEKPQQLVQYANGAVVPEEPLANKLAKSAHFDAKASVYANFARYAPYQHAAAASGYGINRLYKREADAEAQYAASPYAYSPYNTFGRYNAYNNYAFSGYNNAFPYAQTYAPRAQAYSPFYPGYGLNQFAYGRAVAPQVAAKPLTYTLPQAVTYKIDEEQESPASTLRYITKRDAEADAQFYNAATPYTTPYAGRYNAFSGYNAFPYTAGINGAYSAYNGYNAFNGYNALSGYTGYSGLPAQYRPYNFGY